MWLLVRPLTPVEEHEEAEGAGCILLLPLNQLHPTVFRMGPWHTYPVPVAEESNSACRCQRLLASRGTRQLHKATRSCSAVGVGSDCVAMSLVSSPNSSIAEATKSPTAADNPQINLIFEFLGEVSSEFESLKINRLLLVQVEKSVDQQTAPDSRVAIESPKLNRTMSTMR